MGDVAVGARSGHDGEEHRGNPAEADGSGSDGAMTTGNDATGDGAPQDGQGSPTGGAGDATPPPRKPRSFWKELPILVLIALVLALLIKTFLVQAFSIPSASMENTLQIGDRVLVDKLTPWFGSEPERGEVVVFHDPDDWLAGEPAPNPNAVQKVLSWIGLMPSANEKDLIKRVVGVGGDTVECKGTGPLLVNGKALNESSYIYPGNTPCSQDDQGGQFKVKVPKGFIWVMGDHRQNSRDSRYNQSDRNHGFVPVDKVVGRAIVKAWPINHWGTLSVPDTFEQPGLSNQQSSAASLTVAPEGVAVAAVAPALVWRRRRGERLRSDARPKTTTGQR
ncbi:signal peptidase I [Streptomyces sp. NPDC014983]|uniref:signal peptidase I n=1 Tax=Streptomyces sp. NPDC014983 TaxID=3364933 RepID=UPI0036F98AE8